MKKTEYSLPFFSALIVGFLTHMYVFVNKFPNSDAMTNFHFNQNMVTSGRWFLMPACAISSYYDLNWIIGVLSVLYLSVAAVLLTRFFEVKTRIGRILIPALLVTFPAVTSTAAYLYTMDGYMIAVILAILAPLLTKKYKWGFLPGGVLLAFSLGIYQAYLAMTVLLCLFAIMEMVINRETLKKTWIAGVKYLAMGGIGGVLYYVILQICLAVSGKELDTYQGLNEMGSISLSAIPERIYKMYYDFAAFALKGRIFMNSGFSTVLVLLLVLVSTLLFVVLLIQKKTYKDWYRLLILAAVFLVTPFCCNIVLLMSGEVNYHLLMRMQWVIFPMICVVLFDRIYEKNYEWKDEKKGKVSSLYIISQAGFLLIAALSFHFAICDNVAYFNMNERYEKTYAYCLRLLDRMEQTEGYQPLMEVAMIGVVNEENYPDTDITTPYTERISGANGSILLNNGIQYAGFMRHYLNVVIYPVSGNRLVEIYNSPEYQALDAFPAANSMKVVDGILYIKTE